MMMRHFRHGGRHGFGGHGPMGRDEAWFGEEGRFEGRRGGPGRRRMFDSGELRLVLLRLVADKARHGYDLIRAIEERTGGAYAPSPGVVYPTLTLLTEMGLVEEKAAEGARKIFEITPEGIAHLAERAQEVDALLARLDATGEMRGRTDVMPIRRAMHNLRSVLHHRLGEGLDEQRLYAAVELIDEAARKIERL
jgi:DNA-binding PadR family transcriptional regulator